MGETWVDKFLSTPIGRYFIRVDQNYLRDQFNHYGLRSEVENYRLAFDCIKGMYIPKEKQPEMWPRDLDHSAYILYGLLHRRYLMSPQGCDEMYNKFINGVYGKCPNVACRGQLCLPCGPSEQLNECKLCIFCPKCHEVYYGENPVTDKIDGAFFGQSYIMIFMKKFKDKIPRYAIVPQTPLRLFGFKIALPTVTNESEEEEEETNETDGYEL